MTRWPLLIALAALGGCAPAAPAKPKPELALLTSLPVVFGERFSLQPPESPLRDALEKEFTLRPVDGPEPLKPGERLLAIQPQALTAERLVALDGWVRAGGRMILLADPRLEWDSDLPLGDKFRPPFSFPDTGLLAHWGLRLEEPATSGPQKVAIGGHPVSVVSAGRLVATGPACRVADGGLTATCWLGKGQVTVVADADWVLTGAGALAPDEAADNYPVLLGIIAGR